ncbi:MAG: sugar phosphate isomerase/epimerase [Candidatus Omnitrophica bacterium]|nr:sugar phosphate isomerase/epimerase [Candidatus Omnitrophota bacterium]
MLSLSTSWNSSKHTSGVTMINEIKSLGFDSVELNFALTAAMVDDVLALKEAGVIRVSSLHNMCPLPAEIEPRKASPDYYSLASNDDKERSSAVAAAMATIDCAARLAAKAVVIHSGKVDIKDRIRELAALVNDNKDFVDMRERMFAERSAAREIHLANAVKSMRELVPYAKKAGIKLGLENRYYYREIPVMDEFEMIFGQFPPDELFYWHDVGHAEVFDRLGICHHKTLLDKFAGRLLGVHLHDIIGPINDHRPPGRGTFDFNVVRPYLKPETIMVLEVHQPASADDIRESVIYLRGIFDNI